MAVRHLNRLETLLSLVYFSLRGHAMCSHFVRETLWQRNVHTGCARCGKQWEMGVHIIHNDLYIGEKRCMIFGGISEFFCGVFRDENKLAALSTPAFDLHIKWTAPSRPDVDVRQAEKCRYASDLEVRKGSRFVRRWIPSVGKGRGFVYGLTEADFGTGKGLNVPATPEYPYPIGNDRSCPPLYTNREP